MLLLDVTGSMNYGTSQTDSTPRKQVIREALGLLVAKLGAEDSQAGHEAEGGGIRTVTFSGGNATDIGDINSSNIKQKWAGIKFAGGTKIMPGWNKIFQVFNEEFGSRPPQQKPALMLLIITDGDADDHDQFAAALKRLANEKIFVTIAVIGYGPDYTGALETYKGIGHSNPNLVAIPFGSETNPEAIAEALLKMVD